MNTHNIKLISHVLCPYVQRARIILNEKNIKHEIEFIDLNDPPSYFLDISPLAKVPVLMVYGQAVFESLPIIEYLNEVTPGNLHPEDALQKAKNRAWMEFAAEILNDIGGLYSAADQVAFSKKTTALVEKFTAIERRLGQGRYFNGDDFCMVDAVYGPVFRYFTVMDNICDLAVFETTPKVSTWRVALQQRPSIESAVVSDYPDRLRDFFLSRDSFLTQLM